MFSFVVVEIAIDGMGRRVAWTDMENHTYAKRAYSNAIEVRGALSRSERRSAVVNLDFDPAGFEIGGVHTKPMDAVSIACSDGFHRSTDPLIDISAPKPHFR